MDTSYAPPPKVGGLGRTIRPPFAPSPPTHYTPDMTAIPMALPSGGTYAPGKLMWWHDAIIDTMIAEPRLTKKDIATKLSCTPTFIYMITNSDLFKARYAQRRQEYERQLGVGLVEKVAKVADATLDRILERVKDPGAQVPLQQLESLADKTLSRLGYNPQRATPAAAPATVNVQVERGAHVVVAPVEKRDLDAARSLIHQREEQLALATPDTVIDVSPNVEHAVAPQGGLEPPHDAPPTKGYVDVADL